MGERETVGWCILRTSGARTLRLAESLAMAGREAWTPSEARRQRGRRGRERVPIMPTYVFARVTDAERDVAELARLGEDPHSPHPPFSLFRHYLRTPIIADDELAYLRDAEEQAVPINLRPKFEPGEGVKVTKGPFEGLSGEVRRCEGGYALVLFGRHRVKISTFILKPNGIISPAQTAKAA